MDAHKIHTEHGNTINISPAPVYVQDNFPQLTYRQYLAATVLQGYLANERSWRTAPSEAAKEVLQYVDAVIKELGLSEES